jgi:hypothetical protein
MNSTAMAPNIKSTPPSLSGTARKDRVERQEVPFRNDVRRRDQRVGLDVVVRVAEVVRQKKTK